MHTYTQIHALLQSRENTLLFLTFAHKKQESLWGRCVISMSLSLVVKTAKTQDVGSPCCSLLPPPQSRETMAERWGGHVDDGPSEWRGGPWLGAGVVCTDAGISRAETGLVHFCFMVHNTRSAQSGTFARLMVFKKIWAQTRFRIGHKTEMQC